MASITSLGTGVVQSPLDARRAAILRRGEGEIATKREKKTFRDPQTFRSRPRTLPRGRTRPPQGRRRRRSRPRTERGAWASRKGSPCCCSKNIFFVLSTLAVTQAPPMTSSTSRLGNSFLANRFSSFTATFSEGGKEKYCRSSRIPRARRTNSLCAYFVPSGLVPLPAGERRGHG